VTALDGTLMEELTGSLAGCLGTIELALAVTTDPGARRALEAVGNVIATSHEHLSRVDAMVFASTAVPEPAGPLTMGQPDEEECLHLDLLGPLPGGGLVCRDCAESLGVPDE
jgi:hypothetical protein